MAKYRITSPDGGTFEITAPDDATEEQVMQYAQQNMPKQEKPKRTPAEMRRAFDAEYWQTALSGPFGAAARLSGAEQGLRQTSKAMEEGAYEAGGRVTDIASRVLPPGGAAGLGYATNVGLNAIPALAGGGIGAMAGREAAVPLRGLSEWFMSSALKARGRDYNTIAKQSDVIDTMLDKGIPVSEEGVAKLRGQINDLNERIKSAISKSSETINKQSLYKYVDETLDKFQNQVDAVGDITEIKKVWNSFKNNPRIKQLDEIPVQTAQDIKQGTYRQLSEKYGQLGTANVETQKSLARGLREGIGEKIPETIPLNQEEAKLLKALKPTEARVLQELRNNPGGLAWLAHNPTTLVSFLADKSSHFKSLVAIMLDKSRVPLSQIGGAAAGVAGQQAMQRQP